MVSISSCWRRRHCCDSAWHHWTDAIRSGGLRRSDANRAIHRHTRHRVLPELPHQQAAGEHGARPIHALCRVAWTDAVDDLLAIYGRVDHPHLLHLGGVVRRTQPLRLHHAARSLADRVVPDHGPVRAHPGDGRQHVPGQSRARLRHLGDRRADLRRPDRLGHPEDQGDV